MMKPFNQNVNKTFKLCRNLWRLVFLCIIYSSTSLTLLANHSDPENINAAINTGCEVTNSPFNEYLVESNNTNFVKIYGDDIANAWTEVKEYDNTLYALGYRTTVDPDVHGVFSKINMDGTINWSVQLPNTFRVFDFIQTEGGFILVGGTRPFNSAANSLICKISEDGNLLWSKEYNFAGREYLTRIQPATDPLDPVFEYYVFGITSPVAFDDDQILVRIDKDGTEISNKKFDFGDDQLQSEFKRLRNGNYVFIGSKGSSAQVGVMDESGTQAFYAADGSGDYRLREAVEANGKVYLVGNTDTNGYILILDATGTKKIASYTLPDSELIYAISANENGDIYLTTQGDIGDGIARPLIYKLNEQFDTGNSTMLSVDWTKTIDLGESTYRFANISISNDKLIYFDSRLDVPNGFGSDDALLGVFDLEMNGTCITNVPNHNISAPIILDNQITQAFTITEQEFPTATSFMLNSDFSLEHNDTYCASTDPACIAQEVNISTGYEPISDTYLTPLDLEPNWQLIGVPPTSSGVTVPRAPYVINKFPSWSDAPNAEWLSPFQVSNFGTNNWCPGVDCEDCPSFLFERCFCVPEAGEITLDFDVLHDDFFYLELVGPAGFSEIIYKACEQPIGGNYFVVPRSVDTTFTLPAGEYCLQANLFNAGGVAMGFNLEGVVSGITLEKDSCCSNVGSIAGTVYNDLDCDGILDLTNSTLLDQPLQNWEVTLCTLNGTPISTTTSDVNGNYAFLDISPGNYSVKQTNQSGWSPSNPNGGQIFVDITATGIIEVNFGNCEIDPACIAQEVNISTGYEPISDSYLTPLDVEPSWQLVAVPPSSSGVTVPRAPYVINKFPSWSDAPNAEWLSPFQVSNFGTNNWCPGVDCEDCPSFLFERCFCVPEAGEITLDFDVLHDDFFYLELVGPAGFSEIIYKACEQPIGGNYFVVPRSVDTTFTLPAGEYCLQANLFNVGGVAMGFNLEGVVSGITLEKDSCCSNVGSIAGTVYKDEDCDGFLDLTNNTLIDPPLQDWVITLCDLSGNPIDSVHSDVNGNYAFLDIIPGNYILKQTDEMNWSPSSPTDGDTTITIAATGIIEVNFGNCPPVSTLDHFKTDEIIIYPNPTSDHLYLKLDSQSSEDLKMEIRDLTGRLIKTADLNAQSNLHELNVQSWPNAMYYISVRSNSGKTWNSKFIKH